jgi:Putative beta-barrel porin-2, OmpL-like. bbp2
MFRARLTTLVALLLATPRALAQTAPSTDFQPAVTPFAWGDFSWAPGNYAPPTSVLQHGAFTGELRIDTAYHFSLAAPIDNTISGSSEVFRHGELQVTQIGFGGDVYYKGVHARLMTQFGMYSQTTPRNDPSAARGQWNLDDAYRYISEAYAGYHVNALAGINVQAGIFMSYVGLWAYYNFDNWTYQPSYVSSNTPWFFNGVRAQIYVNDRLKIEPWLVNGWQAYGQFNQAPGVGLQVRWAPAEWLNIISNNYAGTDTLGVPGRLRVHTDDSVMARLYHRPGSAGLSKMAASLTLDAGCEFGNGVEGGAPNVACSEQYFLGFMAYARFWFHRDMFGLTVGGGAITNPGRYLVLMPPINGATAFSGTPYFTANKGDPYNAWDVQTTFDVMPTRNITFRLEYTHRAADVPYFSGSGGVTPPGGNQGAPGSRVMGWSPDLANTEDRLTAALMLRL